MGKPRVIGRMRRDGDRWMLVAPELGLVLSDTAHAALELCDGTREESEIVAALRARFASADGALEKDVRDLLAALRRRALVEDA